MAGVCVWVCGGDHAPQGGSRAPSAGCACRQEPVRGVVRPERTVISLLTERHPTCGRTRLVLIELIELIRASSSDEKGCSRRPGSREMLVWKVTSRGPCFYLREQLGLHVRSVADVTTIVLAFACTTLTSLH